MPTWRSALRHFATHRLGAANRAREQAERSFFAGDQREYRHWLAICRKLDKRLAKTLEAMDDTLGRDDL